MTTNLDQTKRTRPLSCADNAAYVMDLVKNYQAITHQENAIAQKWQTILIEKKRLAAEKQRLKQYVVQALKRSDQNELQTQQASIKLVQGERRIVIDDPNAVPNRYVDLKKSIKADMVKQTLSKGCKIPGVRLVTDCILKISHTPIANTGNGL